MHILKMKRSIRTLTLFPFFVMVALTFCSCSTYQSSVYQTHRSFNLMHEKVPVSQRYQNENFATQYQGLQKAPTKNKFNSMTPSASDRNPFPPIPEPDGNNDENQ